MRKKETISKILKLRDNRKKEIEIEVKKAFNRVDEESFKLQTLQKDYNDRLKYFKETHGNGSCSARDIISHHECLSKIDGMIEEQKKVYSRCEGELELLKKTLAEAHKDKKALEIMDEKVSRREQRENDVREQKDADFIALTRKVK